MFSAAVAAYSSVMQYPGTAVFCSHVLPQCTVWDRQDAGLIKFHAHLPTMLHWNLDLPGYSRCALPVSHTGITVMPRCFKDDSVSQCSSKEKSKIWPPLSPESPNRWSPNLAWVMRSCEKFHHDPIRGFNSPSLPLPRAGRYVQSDSDSFLGFGGGGSFSSPEPSPAQIFYYQYPQMVSFRARIRLLGSWKQNFTFRPHFPQNANFGAVFDWT